MRLCHFDADRPATHDDQVLRHFGEIEDGLVGVVRDRVQAGDRRHHRRGAGGDNEALGLDADVAGYDLVRPSEARRVLDDLNTEALEALNRVVWRDGAYDAMHMSVHLGKVDGRLVAVDAELAAVTDGLGSLAGGDQGLGGDAAVVEAIAAHLALFEEHGLGAHLGGTGGDAQATRAGTDDGDVRRDGFLVVVRHDVSPA